MPSLSAAERKRLSDALAYQEAQRQHARFQQRDYHFWDRLNDTLELLPGQRVPLERFAAKFGQQKFQDVVQSFHSFIDEACDQTLCAPPVRTALLCKSLECLLIYLNDLSIPPTPLTMCQQARSIQQAVERQFPGYIRAKLLHVLARPAGPLRQGG
jgi:hypothetical protein